MFSNKLFSFLFF